jgi:four helix bundle protein
MYQSYRELLVWNVAMDLVDSIYIVTRSFPKEENYALVSQMRRSVTSIPSNIAEGKGRNSDKELLYFIRIAQGSLCELETQIEIAKRQKYLIEQTVESLLKTTNDISRMLFGLAKHFKEKPET